ncbi:cell division protein ZapA [Wenzhouxiangella sp. XN79A]|uniref:cell division protein ZapA n=1 Tax=Wenzhouxiangella sp. XN79A TaxID=2724193 RepID=UPI00144AB462|nr:cell division protein ZapA [Wenzhouxiangella sp. XN79A]NKI36060.1 cell division protein ZapA [Wenzhouxiangella sp. XN79A]
MAEPELVSVRILDREFKVMCQPGERRGLMEAALFLDGQMREIRESGKLTSMEKIAVMCALNLADELVKLRQESADRREQVDQRLLDLAGRLDGTGSPPE